MNRVRKNVNSRKAFTLIEVMVVGLLIGILAAISMLTYTNITRNSRRSTCIANLKQIDTAIARWSVENNTEPGADPDEAAVYSYIVRGKPRCPSGGNYTLEPCGSEPSVSCDVEGHRLP
jgi:prepilin-type N-terminal cleavage/methylation domain-containing protein